MRNPLLYAPYQTLLCFILLLSSLNSFAEAPKTDKVQAEIATLITAVETSGCTFYRNGKTHTAQEGADHLRLKLRRGAKYAKTTESFIDKLASKSSWTGKSYEIECNKKTQTINSWLHSKLQAIRKL